MAEDGKKDRDSKKAAMKKEAEELGISYDELKKQRKKGGGNGGSRKRESAEALDSREHQTEVKRLRAYSNELNDDNDAESSKRRRTRSMDVAEENETYVKEEKKLSPDEWRKEHTLTLRGHGSNVRAEFPNPYIEFKDAPFSERIQTLLTRAGFARPTVIQAQAWPLAIQGKDLISIAKTGSGKTCGFLLPVFHDHEQNNSSNGGGAGNANGYRNHGGRGGGPRVKPKLLVLAPTRELSVQILEEAQKFGRPLGVRSVCCYGGSSKYPQIQALERGVECVIACPGRLNDLIEMGKADLSSIKYLVLDEADRMLDMVSLFIFGTSCQNGGRF